MIDDKAFSKNPVAYEAVQHYYQKLAQYWRSNVKRYFSKTEDYWKPLREVENNRTVTLSLSKKELQRQGRPRLADALLIKWNAYSGRVTVYPKKIMVRGGKSDLVTILSVGGKTSSPKTYRAELDYRVPRGSREAHDVGVWTAWMNEFVSYADSELEILADRLAEILGDSVVQQFVEEF